MFITSIHPFLQYTSFSVYFSPPPSPRFSTSRLLGSPVVMVAMPRTIIFFSTIIFMLLSAQASGSDSGKPKVTKLMVEACKKALINNPYNESVTQEFCSSTLQSNNRSAEAKDLPDLVLVTVDIFKAVSLPLVVRSSKSCKMPRREQWQCTFSVIVRWSMKMW